MGITITQEFEGLLVCLECRLPKAKNLGKLHDSLLYGNPGPQF